MYRLLVLSRLRTLCAAAALALFAGCSGGSANAPNPASPQRGAHSAMGHAPGDLIPFGPLNINTGAGIHIASHYSCPTTGALIYVVEASTTRAINSIIDVYTGKFAGQAPCGQIASGLLRGPYGLFVDPSTHDLYVANTQGFNILVFHRGQTTPYNSYTDPGVQYVVNVTVAKDATVIAINTSQYNGRESGSLSTWIGGPNGGKFVGNFPLGDAPGDFLTVLKDGTVYFMNGALQLWYVSCPLGACGIQTRVMGVSFQQTGGMASSPAGDLLVTDPGNLPFYPATADTFELPNPSPSTFPMAGVPVSMAINTLGTHWFVTDPIYNYASEYLYPGGRLVGTVQGSRGSRMYGIAFDP